MNEYSNRKHEQKRWKQHRLMQAIAQQDKRRHEQSRLTAAAMFDTLLTRVAEQCDNPNCPIHGTQARADSN
jgi:hypothetical protein